MNYFKGLIHCVECSNRAGKNVYYNRKIDRRQNNVYYLCSHRKNYKTCDSPILKEDMLLDIIQRHCSHEDKNFSIEKVKWYILRIDIQADGIYFRWRDGDVSVISDTQIVF